MSRRALVIEDESAIREIVRLSLERVGGWRVEALCCGTLAIDLVAGGERFDAVLLDVMMPELDGPATLKGLQAAGLPPATPVIFLTAKVQSCDRERLRSLGAAGVIAKPFDPMELPRDLETILAAPSPGCATAVGLDPGPTLERHGATIDKRLDRIEAALGSGDPDLRRSGHAAAHQLTGLLGTIGLGRGSELARELEAALLVASGAGDGGVYPAAAALRELLDAARSASLTTSSGST